MRRVYRRKRPFEYLFPFLVFLGIGVIGVLGFQLWNSLQGAKGDVYFYVASGKSKLLQYGMKEWENAYSGTKISLGDSVKTGTDSRAILQFFNGTLVRLADDTQVTVTDITKRSDVEKIALTVSHGSVWVNKSKTEGVDQSDLTVRTTHLIASDVGTVFEVESKDAETVRVQQGIVKVQILDTDNKDTVLDTVVVSVGQEMTLDQALFKSFQNHETPSVLMAMNDQFKLSDWFIWNLHEDESPTDFSHVNLVAAGSITQTVVPVTQVVTQQQNAVADSVSTLQTAPEDSVVQAPVIVSPNPAMVTVNKNSMVINGKVVSGVAKVIVNQTVNGVPDTYTLGKFKSGDTAFTYNVSEALGNLKPGKNVYRFYAIDMSGKRSDSTSVEITYNESTAAVPGPLVAPTVLKFNGSVSSTVNVGVVKVEGAVAGADKVVVSGFTLGKFQPGDKTWVYYANVDGGNLKPGVNDYEVHAVDAQGNKSEVTKFTITYNKPVTGETSPATQTSTPPTGTVPVGASPSSTTPDPLAGI